MTPLPQQPMRVLELTGVVTAVRKEGRRSDYIETFEVDGRDIICAINDVFPETRLGSPNPKPLTIMVAHGGSPDLYTGAAWAVEGDPGYSSYTPESSCDFWVGGQDGRFIDFAEKLDALEGQTVHVRVDDGPQMGV